VEEGFFRRIVMFTVGTCVIAGEYPLSCPGTDETQKRVACGEEEREKRESKKEKKKKEKQKRLVDIRHNGLLEEKKHRRRYFTHAEAESIADRAKFFDFFFFSLKARALRHTESDVVDWIGN
jgi:hypothetical protein